MFNKINPLQNYHNPSDLNCEGIKKIYLDLIKYLLEREHINRNIKLKSLSDFKSSNQLFDYILNILKYEMLKEIGDYKTVLHFIKILKTQNFYSEKLNFLENFLCFFSDELEKIKKQHSNYSLNLRNGSKSRIMLSLNAWGQPYVNNSINYCLSSLNLQMPIKGKQTIYLYIYIYTTEKFYQKFVQFKNEIRKLNKKIVFIIKIIPTGIIGNFSDIDDKYYLLGGLQSIQLHQAKKYQMKFSMLFPDLIYSKNFLSNSMTKIYNGYDVYLYMVVSSKSCITKYIEREKSINSISIPYRELLNLSMEHLSQRSSAIFAEKLSNDQPVHSGLWFICGKSLIYHGGHLNISIIEPTKIKSSYDRYYLTLDSELDKFIESNSNIAFQTDDDEIFACAIEEGDNLWTYGKINYPNYISSLFNLFHLDIFKREISLISEEKYLKNFSNFENLHVQNYISNISDQALKIIQKRQTENLFIVKTNELITQSLLRLQIFQNIYLLYIFPKLVSLVRKFPNYFWNIRFLLRKFRN